MGGTDRSLDAAGMSLLVISEQGLHVCTSHPGYVGASAGTSGTHS